MLCRSARTAGVRCAMKCLARPSGETREQLTPPPSGRRSETPPSRSVILRVPPPLEGEVTRTSKARPRRRGYSKQIIVARWGLKQCKGNIAFCRFHALRGTSAEQRFARAVTVRTGRMCSLISLHTKGGCPPFYEMCNSSRRSRPQFAHTCASAVSLREPRQGSASLAHQRGNCPDYII